MQSDGDEAKDKAEDKRRRRRREEKDIDFPQTVLFINMKRYEKGVVVRTT